MTAESGVDGEEPVVHEQDGELRGAGDGEVEHRGDKGELEVEDVGGRVDVIGVRVVGDGFAVWIDCVAFRTAYRSVAAHHISCREASAKIAKETAHSFTPDQRHGR